MPYACCFLWQENYIEDFKWCLPFQFGVAFWRVVLREHWRVFEGHWRLQSWTLIPMPWFVVSHLSCWGELIVVCPRPKKWNWFLHWKLWAFSCTSDAVILRFLLYHSLLTGACKFHLTFTLHGSFRNEFGVGAIFETVWKAARYTYYDLIPCIGAKQ